ncbi:unnamed protein product, partial [Musa textilis]
MTKLGCAYGPGAREETTMIEATEKEMRKFSCTAISDDVFSHFDATIFIH